MALPDSGAISMSQVREELGTSGAISLGSESVRNLAGIPSGSISMSQLRGKGGFAGPIVSVTLPSALFEIGSWIIGDSIVVGPKPLPAPYGDLELTSIVRSYDTSEPIFVNVRHYPNANTEVPRIAKICYVKIDNDKEHTTTEHSITSEKLLQYHFDPNDPFVIDWSTGSMRNVKIGFVF